jgi:glycopeptide antibiotics resistance protein
VSVTAIAVLTLLPEHSESEVRLRPFSEIGEAIFGPDAELLLEIPANVLLFLPLGAALSLRGVAIGRAALFGLCVSASVELAQLLFVSGRTASVDDVLLNTLGAVVGNAVMSSWKPDRRRPSHVSSKDHPGPEGRGPGR